MPQKELIEYLGRFLTLPEIARAEGVREETLRKYYKKTENNINKAVKLCEENSRGPRKKKNIMVRN